MRKHGIRTGINQQTFATEMQAQTHTLTPFSDPHTYKQR